MSEVTRFDEWLKNGGPAALVAREKLESVEGPNAVIFPPTYAAAEDKSQFPGGYNIDVFPDEKMLSEAAEQMAKNRNFRPTIDQFPSSPNIGLVDSVGSQANRIEPLFAEERYCQLVPQIEVTFPDKEAINLLHAGHRAGDALIRFTEVGESLWEAFHALKKRDAGPLAKISPTSLVFGVWDSRGTQEKVPRAFRAVIRATNVRKLTRSAQFTRATKYVERGYIAEKLDSGDGEKNPLSREGFNDNPATGSHGGVRVEGEIVREMIINLSALRRLCAAGTGDSEENLKLRRYVLGLALVSATATTDDLFNLREGCLLRQKPGDVTEWKAVPHRGEDVPVTDLTGTVAFEYAAQSAQTFGVGPSGSYPFDKATAEKWLALKKDDQEKRRRNGPITQQFESKKKEDKS